MNGYLPAFPQGIAGTTDGGMYTGFEQHPGFGGMTLRDYFAAKAMGSMIVAATHWDGHGDALAISEYAYQYAEAMLKERVK